MAVVVLNSGGSSVKFRQIAIDPVRIAQNDDMRLCQGRIERIGGEAIIKVQTRRGRRQQFTASIPDISGGGIRALPYGHVRAIQKVVPLFTSWRLIRALASRWLGLEPITTSRYFMLSTASLMNPTPIAGSF
jgi:hypothetical protein